MIRWVNISLFDQFLLQCAIRVKNVQIEWTLRVFLMISYVIVLYRLPLEANHSSFRVFAFIRVRLLLFVSSSSGTCDGQPLS